MIKQTKKGINIIIEPSTWEDGLRFRDSLISVLKYAVTNKDFHNRDSFGDDVYSSLELLESLLPTWEQMRLIHENDENIHSQ